MSTIAVWKLLGSFDSYYMIIIIYTSRYLCWHCCLWSVARQHQIHPKWETKKNTHSVYEISQDFFFQLSSRSLCEQKEKGERKTRRQFSVFRRFVKCDTIFFEIKYLIANTNTEHIILLLRTGLGWFCKEGGWGRKKTFSKCNACMLVSGALVLLIALL